LKGQRQTHPRIARRACTVRYRGHRRTRLQHQFASRLAIINAEHNESCGIWGRSWAQNSALDVVQLKPYFCFICHGSASLLNASIGQREILPELLQALRTSKQSAEDRRIGHEHITSPRALRG